MVWLFKYIPGISFPDGVVDFWGGVRKVACKSTNIQLKKSVLAIVLEGEVISSSNIE